MLETKLNRAKKQIKEIEIALNEENKQKKEAENIEKIKIKLLENEKQNVEAEKRAQIYSELILSSRNNIEEKQSIIKITSKQITQIESEIKIAKKAKINKLYRFGDFMIELVRDMEKKKDQGAFKQKPRGPIGIFIRPKEQKYSLAIENCIGTKL